MNDRIKLLHGDCLELMKEIPDGSVDLILTDPPFGTTACSWDSVIPFEPMWEQLHRVIKENGAIVLFSKEPFTSSLVCSNVKFFKQRLIWRKDNHDNPMQAKRRFLNVTEDISVFYNKQCIYNPQGVKVYNKETKQGRGGSLSQSNERGGSYLQKYTGYPNNILKFSRDRPQCHPTQKPVGLLEYLIKTYTNEDDTVLDFTAGSGSTGVACVNTNRKFIGIELDDNYFKIAKDRINEAILNNKEENEDDVFSSMFM